MTFAQLPELGNRLALGWRREHHGATPVPQLSDSFIGNDRALDTGQPKNVMTKLLISQDGLTPVKSRYRTSGY